MTVTKERNIYEKISREDVKKRLVEIFGASNVSDKQGDLYAYSYDMTECEPKMPDFVVIPENVEQLVELVKFCNANVIPIVPYISGNNVGGLTIPEHGGIIIHFGKKMNKILHINENMMYALLEPGVTFGQLKKHLDENYPNLRYSYPFAPPYSGVVGNAILSGMNNMSNKIGSMGDSVNGVEVITADGTIARIGSCFYGKDEADPDSWWSRYPMPDLLGLFINWQGMTGLVTKCAVQLWPNNPYKGGFLGIGHEASDISKILRAVGKTEVVDDCSLFSTEAAKLIFNIEHPKRFPGEPGFVVVMPMSAKTEDLFEAKKKYLKETFDKLKEEGNNVLLMDFEEFTKLFGLRARCIYDLPSVVLPTVLSSGLTWFGSYAPTHKYEKLFEEGTNIFKKHGFDQPIMYGKVMKGGHYGIFRPILPFTKYKDEEKIREIMREVAELGISEGCIPYKTANWLTERMRKEINPGWLKLFDKIKNCIDPNNIFNPGKWS
jgi:hypothetical protein